MSESRQYEQSRFPCYECGRDDWVWYMDYWDPSIDSHYHASRHYLVGVMPGNNPIHSLQPRCKEHRDARLNEYAMTKLVLGDD